jgi:hypothetical protein
MVLPMSPSASLPGRRRTRSRLLQTPLVLVLAMFALGPSLGRAEGQLQSIRDDVRAPRDRPSSKTDYHDHHHGDHCDGEDFVGELCGEIFGPALAYMIASPFWAPHSAMGDSFARSGYFPRYPYRDVPGYMTINGISRPRYLPDVSPMAADGSIPPPAPSDWATLSTRTWACRFRSEYADDFSGRSRIGGHLLLTSTSRFGVDTGFDSFQEDLFSNRHDALWLGDFNVVFRFAQSERAQFRAGFGFNWMDDEIDTDFGFNFTYGMDLYPCRPWVISATLDWGTLGNTGLFHFRTTGGVVFHGIEAYTGYDYYAIGSTRIHGMVGGVRVWF